MYVDDIKLPGKKQNIDPMWKVLIEPTSFLGHVYLVGTQRECETSKDIMDNYKICSNPESPQEQQKNYLARRDLMRTSLHGPMMWKVFPRKCVEPYFELTKKQLSNSSKSQLHALMTINSKKKNWDLLQNCQKYAFKTS